MNNLKQVKEYLENKTPEEIKEDLKQCGWNSSDPLPQCNSKAVQKFLMLRGNNIQCKSNILLIDGNEYNINIECNSIIINTDSYRIIELNVDINKGWLHQPAILNQNQKIDISEFPIIKQLCKYFQKGDINAK